MISSTHTYTEECRQGSDCTDLQSDRSLQLLNQIFDVAIRSL